ncbi:NAC domain-containing protein 82-like [Chenopodium quinoa]|uniref:NAC domain-containing protein n=1 Tax=Chenopodium quinoa TaxID=63459 RepID=A0A803KN87_CHEQI|nr:NAC domain-containing protein 82-like [Chenopodium quinoa]
MEELLFNKSFLPGVRFHPTDEELFMFYLKRKVLGKSLGPQMISEIDVYKFEPWDLPAMAHLKTKDRYWYFFCPRSKKYPSGGRVSRTTNRGYWKSTGTDSPTKYASRDVGKIKTLIFHMGKAPKGERTNWVMHEYILADKLLADKGVPQDSYAICKIFEKSGAGPKNGEDYGARFIEEEWDSDNEDNVQGRKSGLEKGCGFVDNSPFVADSVISLSSGAPKDSSPVGPPFTAAAAEEPSPFTAAVTTPYIAAATSLDVPNAAPLLSTSVSKASAASVERASILPTSEDELDRLLECFSEDAADADIFTGLGDLGDPSDWGSVLILVSLK